jgi:16S rRNA processing protein RimM
MPEGADAECIVVARIGAAHGVRGEVRLKSFTADPLAVRSYGPLTAETGRVFTIKTARAAAGKTPEMLVVTLEGVTTRDAAEALNGVELFLPRDRLPETEADEFYHADLIGLDAVGTDQQVLGTIIAVHNFGAGDLLEIAPSAGKTVFVPFTRAVVPEIDIAGGRVIVEPPPGLLDEGGDDDGDGQP